MKTKVKVMIIGAALTAAMIIPAAAEAGASYRF